MKILSVVGARPQFIKLAVLSREIRKRFDEVIVHTGQHYDIEMSKVFFEQLNIPNPDYNLEVGSGSHAKQIGNIIIRLEKILIKENPSLVLVYGDTNSTLGGALCAAKLGISVCHVESGMRSYDKIPEEINRVIADHISDIFFCTTETAVGNLENEGITKNVFLVGDLMIDALVNHIKIAEKKSSILKELGLRRNAYMLTTIHRAENTEDKLKLKSILNGLLQSKENIILPLHPRTKKYLQDYTLIGKIGNSNIRIIKPLPYLDMLMLEKNSRKIITDSGGVQKEAYFFKVPCITLRDITEWKETVENGFNILVGSDSSKIYKAIKNFKIRKKHMQFYGKGDASKKMADILVKLKSKIK